MKINNMRLRNLKMTRKTKADLIWRKIRKTMNPSYNILLVTAFRQREDKISRSMMSFVFLLVFLWIKACPVDIISTDTSLKDVDIVH